MNKRTYELREKYPDPGTDPTARLRHVVDVFADEPADSMAVLATSGIHESGKTGLTWGDLKALLALVDRSLDFAPITQQSVELYRIAREPYFAIDGGPEADELPENEQIVAAYDHAAKELAEMVIYEIERRKAEGAS